MSVRLAVSNENFFKSLIANKDVAIKNYNLEILEMDEKSCYNSLINNRVDSALITPLGFAKCLERGNFSLVSGPFLASEGFTSIASIFYNKNQRTLKTCGTANPDNFLSILAKIILLEKYSLDINFIKDNSKKDELLKKYDMALLLEGSFQNDISQDLSEEWFDCYEMPLILGLWAVRSEEFPQNIKEIVNFLIDKNLNYETEVEEKTSKTSRVEKSKGKLIWNWNEDFRKILENTFEILYYHQFIYDIHDIEVI